MPIYEFAPEKIRRLSEAAFHTQGLRERADLQRLLRGQIEVVADDVLVIGEEFGEWVDAKRRIDLLGVDRAANLVVFELKRSEDGGFMELQAIRYAAMVSTMTFSRATEVYQAHLLKMGSEREAREELLDFLGWDEPDEDRFAQAVRIVLVSANFSKELTTSVLWLNQQGLDIRCVRLKPYRDGKRTLVDVQQVIPLPEAMDYTVQIRAKSELERHDRQDRSEKQRLCREFWAGLLVLSNRRTPLFANRTPGLDHWLGTGLGVSGLHANYVVLEHASRIELAMARPDMEWNKKIYDQLAAKREAVEKAFGQELEWRRRDGEKQSMVQVTLLTGGYRDPAATWPETQEAMVDAMVRFEAALRPHIEKLRV